MKQHVMLLTMVGCICLSSPHLLAAEKGHIQVTAPAGIKIFLDSSFKGTTNDDDGGLIIQDVEPGVYTIKAVKTDFAPQSMSLTVVAGEVKAVSLKKFIPKIQIEQTGGPDQKGMTLKTGTLIIQSLPIKCKITIAKVGISYSKTEPKWTAKKFPIGTYVLSATSGSRQLTGEFTVKENSQTNLLLNLLTKRIKIIVPPKPARLPRTLALDLGKGEALKLTLIPAGKFLMGSAMSAEETARLFDTKADDHKDEHPQHRVTISKPFYMGVYEVTQAQWKAVMGTKLWAGKKWVKSNGSHAASYISWDDATKFCETLSKKTGKKVTLPTEAQWEYACRAGSKTVYSFGDDASSLGNYAWYDKNADDIGEDYAHAVGQKRPNAFGLYDMHGNVYEWCSDWYDEKFYASAKNVDPENTTKASARVLRGGSWINFPVNCRVADRFRGTSDCRYYFIGFRVVVVSGSGVD